MNLIKDTEKEDDTHTHAKAEKTKGVVNHMHVKIRSMIYFILLYHFSEKITKYNTETTA